MDKALLEKFGRRLYGKSVQKSSPAVAWDDLTPEKQKEWVRMGARAMTIIVEPRFEPLIAEAKAQASAKAKK